MIEGWSRSYSKPQLRCCCLLSVAATSLPPASIVPSGQPPLPRCHHRQPSLTVTWCSCYLLYSPQWCLQMISDVSHKVTKQINSGPQTSSHVDKYDVLPAVASSVSMSFAIEFSELRLEILLPACPEGTVRALALGLSIS